MELSSLFHFSHIIIKMKLLCFCLSSGGDGERGASLLFDCITTETHASFSPVLPVLIVEFSGERWNIISLRHLHSDEENHCLFNNLIYILDSFAPLSNSKLYPPATLPWAICQLLDFNYNFLNVSASLHQIINQFCQLKLLIEWRWGLLPREEWSCFKRWKIICLQLKH